MDEPGLRARLRAQRADKKGDYKGYSDTLPLDDDYAPEPSAETQPQQSLPSAPAGPGPHKDDPAAAQAGFRGPHLQVMCGPLLKYDTVQQDTWLGYALLVTSDSGSEYTPHDPILAYSIQPASPDLSLANLNIDQGQAQQLQAYPLHRYTAHHGSNTFWRWKFAIPLQDHEQAVTYAINSGRPNTFCIPARGANLRWAGHSCNGFSSGVKTEDFNGPSPLWDDLLDKHKEQPLHVLIGGGDQIYCDPIAREPELHDWISSTDEKWKATCPLTDAMSAALNQFLFNHYCAWFRQGAFAKAIASIPMLNMLDDHDLIDGFGSYPDELMQSPVFSAIGERGFFWYMLFQNLTVAQVDGTSLNQSENAYKSLVVGGKGEYVPYNSQSYLSYLGPNVYALLVDCRAERRVDRIITETTYNRLFDAVRKLPSQVNQLVVLLGVPIAYPRMVFAEKILSSSLNPMGLLAKVGMTSMVNRFNGQAELLDDMTDHWCAQPHKKERNWLVKQCADLARECHLRISFLSGDVHAAACGRFFSKKDTPPEEDPAYILNVISSAIVNTPPPPAMITMLNKLGGRTHKTLHSQGISEDMVPLWKTDTNGKKLKNQLILGRRNYVLVGYDNGALQWDFRVEVSQGAGKTASYTVTAPAVKY